MPDVTEVTNKNQEFTGVVESLGSNGEGIIHIGRTVFFAPFTVVGEKVKLRALKVKNKVGYAKALEILTPADERVRAKCPLFTKCGGCQLQHLRYGSQLKIKTKVVSDALRKIAGIDADVALTVRSDLQYEYRNKLQIPVGVDHNGKSVIGFYAQRSHRIVPVRRCPIHPGWSTDIIHIFSEYMEKCEVPGYNEETGKGILRHITVRDVDGNFLITAVTATDNLPAADTLCEMLNEKFKSFSLWHNINSGDGNAVYGDRWKLLHGEGRYFAHECGVRYEAGPNTFIQVNRSVCRKLYDRTTRFVTESGAKVAIDAYSGSGLLTAMLAKQVDKAYGIEVVREAVDCADELIVPNKLEGKLFNICGKVEDELPHLLKDQNLAETVLVVDPPRKGVDRGTLKALLKSGIPNVAMISCNPATMARDVGILTGSLSEEGNELKKNPNYTAEGLDGYYTLKTVQPFDMFPQTKHVETLVLLTRK